MVHLTDGHYLCQCIVMPTLPLVPRAGHRGAAPGARRRVDAHGQGLQLLARPRGPGPPRRGEPGAWLLDHLRAYMVEAVDGPLFRGDLERDRGVAGPDVAGRRAATSRPGSTRRRTASGTSSSPSGCAGRPRQSMVEFDSVVETRLPFLDHDLVDLIFRTPPELKVGEGIQAHILRRRRPEFLDIPNANTGARVGAGRLVRAASKVRMKVLGKLRRPRVPTLRAAGPLAAPGAATRRGTVPALGSLPRPGDLRPGHRHDGRAPAQQRPEEPHVPAPGPDDLRARPAGIRSTATSPRSPTSPRPQH